MEEIKYRFSIISCAVFMPIGIIGNIISIVIFGHSEFRKQAITTYLIIISIINLTTIFQMPNQLMLHYWSGIVDWNFACKISTAFFMITRQSATWILCLSSVDRMITVMAPMKFQFKDTKKFQIVVVILIFLIITAADFPILYSIKNYVLPNNVSFCSFPLEPNLLWFSTYSRVSLTVFGVILTFIIMITSSALIVWTLLKSKSKFARDKSFRKELNLTKSLLIMDAFFIITTLPMNIYAYVYMADPFVNRVFYILSNFNNIFLFVIFYFCNKLYRAILQKYFPKCLSKK